MALSTKLIRGPIKQAEMNWSRQATGGGGRLSQTRGLGGGVVKPYTDGEKQREEERTRGWERARAESREKERWPQREETPGWEGRREAEMPRDQEGRNRHAENAPRERRRDGETGREITPRMTARQGGRGAGWGRGGGLGGGGAGGGGAGREKSG